MAFLTGTASSVWASYPWSQGSLQTLLISEQDHLTPHSSLLIPHSSPLTSPLPHYSLSPAFSSLTPHSSLLTPHPSPLIPHLTPPSLFPLSSSSPRCRVPGKLNDRRTPLGELNWIFTAITDTIAWNSLPMGEITTTTYIYVYPLLFSPLPPSIIESRDERGFPLMQYIANGGISRARYTITYFKHHHRVLRLISNGMSV